MTKNTNQIIIAVVIIAAIIAGYLVFFPSQNSGEATLTAENSKATEFADGQVILALLNRLNSVTIDQSIFSNKVFLNLTNFDRPIADQAKGRQNPFLPIGKGDISVAPTRATITNINTATSLIR